MESEVMISETGPEYCPKCGGKCVDGMFSWFRATGDRFLDGFEENVISGQCSIRIFGKRFKESKMTRTGKTIKFFENQQNA